MLQLVNNDRRPTCRVVGVGLELIGKQAPAYAPGISAESVGAQGIHLQIVTIPPGGRAKARKHEAHETTIYILRGKPACGTARNWNIMLSLGPGTSSILARIYPIYPIMRVQRTIVSL